MYLFSWLQIKKKNKIQIQNTIQSIISVQVKNG